MTPRFKLGDKVKIRRTWSDMNGAVGIVAEPPDHVRTQSKFGSTYFKQETSLTGSHTILYWIRFDSTGSIPGAIEGEEFDESELEKL
jgi:hypothetical protein